MKMMVTGVGNVFVPEKKIVEPLGLSYCIIGSLSSVSFNITNSNNLQTFLKHLMGIPFLIKKLRLGVKTTRLYSVKINIQNQSKINYWVILDNKLSNSQF